MCSYPGRKGADNEAQGQLFWKAQCEVIDFFSFFFSFRRCECSLLLTLVPFSNQTMPICTSASTLRTVLKWLFCFAKEWLCNLIPFKSSVPSIQNFFHLFFFLLFYPLDFILLSLPPDFSEFLGLPSPPFRIFCPPSGNICLSLLLHSEGGKVVSLQ